ncbi:MAG TPA: MFS transporter [Anaerolineales bacterium]|nr:MFS transporter [Anaerolineales bacterium]
MNKTPTTIQATQRTKIPIFALFTANAISLVGNVLSAIAIPWFVLQTTGSATQTGITGFFTVLPAVLAGFFGGTLVDRLGYKRTSIIADLASGVTTALIPLLYFTVGLEFWQLMVLVFLGALLDSPGSTARSALVPELAEMAQMPIERATSLIHIIERSARLVGAPLAGLLIALIGTENVLWLDAASFFVSAGIIAVTIKVHKPAVHEEKEPGGKYFDELREGLRFIYKDKLMLTIVIMVMLTNFLDAIFGGVVQPVFVKQVYGQALDLGLLIAANGGGAVLGALVFGAIGPRLPRHAVFVFGFVLTSLRFFLFALYPPLWVALVFVVISSMGAGPLNPIISAVEYERVPKNMRGRVGGAVGAGAWSAMPLGMLVGGVLTEQLGVKLMLIGLGVVYFITTLSMAFIPAMKEMNRRKELIAEGIQ